MKFDINKKIESRDDLMKRKTMAKIRVEIHELKQQWQL